MKNIYDDCLIEASGNFLTEHFSESILHCEEEMHEFISNHKVQLVEKYEDEAVLGMIEDLAQSLEQFLKSQISRILSEQFKLGELTDLSNAVDSDIWYDAEALGDVESAKVIADTQESMSSVSEALNSLIMQNGSAL